MDLREPQQRVGRRPATGDSRNSRNVAAVSLESLVIGHDENLRVSLSWDDVSIFSQNGGWLLSWSW